MLSERQLRAVKYYIGDVCGADPFWGDPKAYVVLNSLFFPGIRTETARALEGKRLSPEIISDTGRLVDMLTSLLSAFRECSAEEDVETYRVERTMDYLLCRNLRRTVSFTSTSTAGFLRSYSDRVGIALLRFAIPEGSPCINMAAVLPEYAKTEEAEILLPPGLSLDFTTLPMPEELHAITDANGEPPEIYCKAAVSGRRSSSAEAIPLPEGGNEAGMRVYAALNAGLTPEEDDCIEYVNWKTALRGILERSAEY